MYHAGQKRARSALALWPRVRRDVAAAVRAGRTPDGLGLVLNSSRGILYASDGDDFELAARAATLALREEINRYR